MKQNKTEQKDSHLNNKNVRERISKSSTIESETLLSTCIHFLNSEIVGMAHYELIHQLKELGFPNIGIAQGTAQALYIGNFLYTNSSTPGNLTVFAFHKQEPLLDTCQNDHLVCHLVQTQGQKKSLEEAKTSQKQTVHIPKDFNGMGTQLQLFTAA
jgi:hypothetical protein